VTRSSAALRRIPISQVAVGPEEEELVLSVLRSGQLAQGPMVARLEEEISAITGARHTVAVSSGTTALVCALLALRHTGRVEPGDEVVTSSFTFVATLNAAIQAGLGVRFADIGDDYCMAAGSARRLVGDRTRVLLPVHLYGLCADMEALAPLASEHGLIVVEDAAQALGATSAGRQAGSHGIGCFSLYATKNVAAGEGGAITTDDDEIARVCRLLRNQGMAERYRYEIVGHNFRLTDLQAAVALGQLRRLRALTAARRTNAALLAEALGGIDGLVLPGEPAGRRSVWHQFTVRVTGQARLSRDELAARLEAAGIGTGVYYPRPVYRYPCFEGHPLVRTDPVPTCEQACAQVLSLPVHPFVGEDGVEQIATEVRRALS